MNIKNEYTYPDCLSNCFDLNLGNVYLKYKDVPNIPELTTIYEIEKPLIITLNSLESLIKDINSNHSDNIIKGLFALGVSHLEVLLSDLLKRIVLLHPNSLSILDEKKRGIENNKLEINKEDIVNGNIATNIIERKIDTFFFKSNIELIIKKLTEVLKFDSKIDIDRIVEIKETRNLLLHNNLIVNDIYLNKTRSIRRSEKKGEKLLLDSIYVKDSIGYIIRIVKSIRTSVNHNYSKYTILSLMKRLWAFTFSASGIPILIEDFWTLNFEKDIIDGPILPPKDYFSSSEKLFYEVWRAQRTANPISDFSMVHLDTNSIKKLSFLVEVFGNLRFPHW